MNSCLVKTAEAEFLDEFRYGLFCLRKMNFSKRLCSGFSTIPLRQAARKSATFGRAVRIVVSAETPEGLSHNAKPHVSNVYIRSSAWPSVGSPLLIQMVSQMVSCSSHAVEKSLVKDGN